MADNKNQHFVPRFYLKFFSNNLDQKTIGLWVVSTDKYVSFGGIKNQASADYFYGKNLELEKFLSMQEGLASRVLKKIIKTNSLLWLSEQEHFDILFFVLMLNSRTQYAAEKINEMADKMVKNIMKHDSRYKDFIDKFNVRSSNAVVESISYAFKSVALALDLAPKLIVNLSSIPFVSSDNPVVKHNQYFREKKWSGGHTGIAQIGLQIFFPLSPYHMLIFYDKNVYKVGDKKQNVLFIKNDEDINLLNKIQYLNANKAIFFNQKISEEHIKNVSTEMKKIQGADKVRLEEFESVEASPNKSFIVAMSEANKKLNLNLNFIKILKKARKKSLGPTMFNVRLPELAKKYMESSNPKEQN